MSVSTASPTGSRPKPRRLASNRAKQKKQTKFSDETSASADPSPNAGASSGAGDHSASVGELVWVDPTELLTPHANLLRPGTPEEDNELRASIHASGIQIPLTVTRTHRRVIDGHRRLQQAIGQGRTQVPCLLVEDLSDEQERARVVTLNAVRRHLSPDQKRGLIRELLSRTPEASSRQIAQVAGVAHNTVEKQRRELEATGAIARPETRQGADGKNRVDKRSTAAVPPAQTLQKAASPRETAGSSDSPLEAAPLDAASTVDTAPDPHDPGAAVAPEVDGLTGSFDAAGPALLAPVVCTDPLTELASAVDGCEARVRQLVERVRTGPLPVAPAAVRAVIDRLHQCASALSNTLSVPGDELRTQS